MKLRTQKTGALLVSLLVIVLASTRMNADTGTCGGVTTTPPFADVMNSIFFCQIAEAYFSGLTNGTTASTYSPSANVTREQMAAFVTRTMDQSLKRGGNRAALNQFWTNQGGLNLALTTVGDGPNLVESDGVDLWVANGSANSVSHVRASDGRLIETYTDVDGAFGVLVAMGEIFVTGGQPAAGSPGKLFRIRPASGSLTTVTSSLGHSPQGIAFDGQRIWTTNVGTPTSISIVTPQVYSVVNVSGGFTNPFGITYDGANIWVTDTGDDKIKKVDSNGNVLLSVPVGSSPSYPTFDGTNIWVPNFLSNSISVVRATGGLAGTVLATLTGNGLLGPAQAAFDGTRILVTNTQNNNLSLWNASDLTPIGNFTSAGSPLPFGVCSDGLNFWITFTNSGKLARF